MPAPLRYGSRHLDRARAQRAIQGIVKVPADEHVHADADDDEREKIVNDAATINRSRSE